MVLWAPGMNHTAIIPLPIHNIQTNTDQYWGTKQTGGLVVETGPFTSIQGKAHVTHHHFRDPDDQVINRISAILRMKGRTKDLCVV